MRPARRPNNEWDQGLLIHPEGLTRHVCVRERESEEEREDFGKKTIEVDSV